MDNYVLKTLTENQTNLNNNHIFDMIIHTVKANYRCEEQRKSFTLSRSVGNVFDIDNSSTKANDFLNCYSGILELSKTQCVERYNNLMSCFTKNKNNLHGFPQACVPGMEDFINC